tara:strand:- start:18 stop:1229 length:1212 start_codon:yes stop_codon:yes gene_type:complete
MSVTNMVNAFGGGQLFSCKENDDNSHSNFSLSEVSVSTSLVVSSSAAANLVMLGAGYFCPLTGFHNKDDALSICEDMRMKNGQFWPVPILNMLQADQGISVGDVVALKDPNVEGVPILAYQKVESVERLTSLEMERMAKNIFGTLDKKHPGVATFLSQGNVLIAGDVLVLNYSFYERSFAETFVTAGQIRTAFAQRNWQKVVAFQTRNPMHRAHEELCKIAKNELGADGVLIHMLLGKLKEGDIPADVRDSAIRTMVEVYFAKNTAMVCGYGFDMLYAGPREALLHAVIRQNAGCSHLIVGRDHAGVGDYYSPFAAQEIFHSEFVSGAFEIEIFEADHTAFSKKLNKVVMMRDVPDHVSEDFIMLSGSRVREMLGNGESLPAEFARPEVADILMTYYQGLKNI